MSNIFHIYDRMFKRILTLSDKAVINLINGLFGTEHPLDSKITYNWTEHQDNNLKMTLSDSILTINDRDIYHIEAQMTEDEEIVFRVFEYGFGHAYKKRSLTQDGEILIFPQPKVIYLDEGKKDKVKDEYILTLCFQEQGIFTYKVPVVKLQNISSKELSDRKMVILIPFFLLKLRKKLKKAQTKENIEELQKLIEDDIMGSIDKNETAGNISGQDAYELRNLTWKLYKDIYSGYQEVEAYMRKKYDQSIELISDKYDRGMDELEEEVREKDEIIKELRKTVEELTNRLEKLE